LVPFGDLPDSRPQCVRPTDDGRGYSGAARRHFETALLLLLAVCMCVVVRRTSLHGRVAQSNSGSGSSTRGGETQGAQAATDRCPKGTAAGTQDRGARRKRHARSTGVWRWTTVPAVPRCGRCVRSLLRPLGNLFASARQLTSSKQRKGKSNDRPYTLGTCDEMRLPPVRLIFGSGDGYNVAAGCAQIPKRPCAPASKQLTVCDVRSACPLAAAAACCCSLFPLPHAATVRCLCLAGLRCACLVYVGFQ